MNKTPYRRYVDAKVDRLKSGKDSDEIQRAEQEALYEALWDYATEKTDQFPREMAADLAFAMREILGGVVPKLFKKHGPATGRGKKLSPTAKDAIVDAVRYIRAVEAGLITDSSYKKTVCEAFSVDKSTVRKWLENDEYAHVTVPGSLQSDQIELIARLMKFSGRHYNSLPTVTTVEANIRKDSKRK